MYAMKAVSPTAIKKATPTTTNMPVDAGRARCISVVELVTRTVYESDGSSQHHGGHSRVTHSRNQADTRGHRRTRRRSNSRTGGTARAPQDTRGHAIAPVRDREAPGSNPGPPTKFELNSISSPR